VNAVQIDAMAKSLAATVRKASGRISAYLYRDRETGSTGLMTFGSRRDHIERLVADHPEVFWVGVYVAPVRKADLVDDLLATLDEMGVRRPGPRGCDPESALAASMAVAQHCALQAGAETP